MSRLDEYLDMLLTWNRAFNLGSRRAGRQELAALCAESGELAALIRRLPLPVSPLIWDLGAGAGLPGIPLRLDYTQGSYWLVEAREKRALFLANAVARLGLAQTHVYRGRAEEFFAGRPAPADLILSRAFMPWPRLLPFVRPHIARTGFLLVLSNDAPPQAAGLPGFSLFQSHAYAWARGHRHIWALSPEPAA